MLSLLLFKKNRSNVKNPLLIWLMALLISLPTFYLFVGVRSVRALDVGGGDGLILYGISANTTPQWRTYDGAANTFGTETATVAGGTAANTIMKTSPKKQEAVAAYGNSSGVMQVMCYDGTSWTNEWSVTVGGTGTTRRFDVAYEQSTGNVVVAYSRNAAATNAVDYRTKAGSSGCGTANWAAAASLPTTTSLTTGTVQWVKMARDSRSTSSLIGIIWADSNSDLGGSIWSGTAFGNLRSLETSLEVAAAAQDVDDFEIRYESLSGDVMVVWANSAGANGTNGVRYQTCTGGTSTCTWSATTTPPTFADDATNLDLAENPNSDEMVFASIGNAGSDLQIGYWSGSAWTDTANVDISTETPGAGMKYVSVGWLVSGATTRSVVVYHDSNSTGVDWYTGSAGTFTVQTDFSPTPAFAQGTNLARWYDIQPDPVNKDRLMLSVADSNNDLFAKRLIMDATPTFTWTNADGGAALQASLPQSTAGPMSFTYWQFIPTPTFNQSAYRFFANADSTAPGTALAATNTAATLTSAGDAFRVRALVHVGVNKLLLSGQTFKLQFVGKGTGTCSSPSGGTPSVYTDVTTATAIAYKDNPTPLDGANITLDGVNDPTHGSDTNVAETYEELNNFTNSQAVIPSGQDGEWDFALFDNAAPATTTYCLRIIQSDGTLLGTYTTYPEVTTATPATGPTTDQVMRHGKWWNAGAEQDFFWAN